VNINAARDGERVLRATDGDTTNRDVKLRATIELPPRDQCPPPEGPLAADR
jgi:hypothetical protein